MSKFNVWLKVQGKTLSRDKITRSFRIYQRKIAHKSVKIIPKNIGIHPPETLDNRMTELYFKVSFSSRFVWNWERIPLKLLLSVLSPTQNIVLELGTNIVKGVAICTVPNIEHRFGIRNEYRESCCYLYCPQLSPIVAICTAPNKKQLGVFSTNVQNPVKNLRWSYMQK